MKVYPVNFANPFGLWGAARGLSALKKGLNGDWSHLQKWGAKYLPGVAGKLLGKEGESSGVMDWIKNNKGLAAGIASTGLGLLGNAFNKNRQGGGGMYMMPYGGGMGYGMPMMQPMMGGMGYGMPQMMPMMGGGGMMVGYNGGGGGDFFGTLSKAAMPLLAGYAFDKWTKKNDQTAEEKPQEDDETYINKTLTGLYTSNANNATDIRKEYDSLRESLGDRAAADTLAAKYKNGYTQVKEEAAKDPHNNIMSMFGNKKGFFQGFKENAAREAYENKIATMAPDVRARYEAIVNDQLNMGRSRDEAIAMADKIQGSGLNAMNKYRTADERTKWTPEQVQQLRDQKAAKLQSAKAGAASVANPQSNNQAQPTASNTTTNLNTSANANTGLSLTPEQKKIYEHLGKEETYLSLANELMHIKDKFDSVLL